jgi:hypothetical protein
MVANGRVVNEPTRPVPSPEPAADLDDRFRSLVAIERDRPSGPPVRTARAGPPEQAAALLFDDGVARLEARINALTAKVTEFDDRIIDLTDSHARQVQELTTSIDRLREQLADATSPSSKTAERPLRALRVSKPTPSH